MGEPDLVPTRLPVLAIVGPTASGKSRIALSVAETLGVEIVAVDSMTVYRGMDIGTAKPTRADRERVPHHMLDITDPAHPYNVAQFQRVARAVISSIHARRQIPLLVGGAGLYFRAVVDDLEFPPADPSVRGEIERLDGDELRARLREADPEAAETVDTDNLRRVVRALEVIALTGSPFSAFRESWDRYESRYDLTVAGVAVESEARTDLIEMRIRQMVDAGLVEEVTDLLNAGLREALTSTRAIAYREIVAYLDGTLTLEAAIEAAAMSTRKYARRQLTWFRKDPRVRWFDAADPHGAAQKIARLFSAYLGKLPGGTPVD